MANIKLHRWLIGIFTSIIVIFAMSHNASAISTVFDLTNYTIVKNSPALKINCTFSDLSNNVLSTPTDTWVCTRADSTTGIKLRQFYTTEQWSFNKGDVLEFDLLVWSAFDLNNIDEMNVGFYGSVSGYWSMLGFNQVADNVFHTNAVGSGDTLFDGNGYYSIYRYTLKANNNVTSTIGFPGGYQDHYIWSNGTLNFRVLNINQFRKNAENDTNAEQKQATEDAVEGSENAGNSSSSSAQSGSASLLNVIGAFASIITSAQPTNCNINGNMGNLNIGQIDLCANPVPSFVQIIGSIILVCLVIPFVVIMFNRFISIFRSFQS